MPPADRVGNAGGDDLAGNPVAIEPGAVLMHIQWSLFEFELMMRLPLFKRFPFAGIEIQVNSGWRTVTSSGLKALRSCLGMPALPPSLALLPALRILAGAFGWLDDVAGRRLGGVR